MSKDTALQPDESEIEVWHDAVRKTQGHSDIKLTVVCITKRQWLGKRVLRGIDGVQKYILKGDNSESFAQLCNNAIRSTDTDFVVITSDKCFPSSQTINDMQRLLSHGFGLVCAYRFGCFGVSKVALQKIGLFDERFRGGGFEDADFLIRFWESNVAVLETESIPYFPLPSLWKIASPSQWFNKKWKVEPGEAPIRLTREELTNDFLIVKQEIKLLPFSHSRLCKASIDTGIKFFD
jgi:hypothetical protein